MTAEVSINPLLQSNFAGTFFVTSEGYTQGDDLSDPSIRNLLRVGLVDPNASTPLWGGLAISESLAPGVSGGSFPMTGESASLAAIIDPGINVTAGTTGCITGFSVFRQATAMIQSAQSRVPLAPAGGAISFYPLGSLARIVVKASAAALSAWSASGIVVNQSVYWDTVNLQVTNAAGSNIVGPIPGVILSEPPNVSNSRIVSYSSGTNFANWVENGGAVVIRI